MPYLKVVQYINLIKSDDLPGTRGNSFTTYNGGVFPWLPADEFEYDNERDGHGTHVAGSAAGATLNTPAKTVSCEAGKILSCVGDCKVDNSFGTDDDDIDRLCLDFGCDADTNELCLGNDVGQTLTDNGGAARGAKLAIFDVFFKEAGLSDYPGNGLWEPCAEVGCKLHSASLGGEPDCEVDSIDILYDEFMYQVMRRWLILRRRQMRLSSRRMLHCVFILSAFSAELNRPTKIKIQVISR